MIHFYIYSKLGSFSAKDRADAISSNKKNCRQIRINTDSITIAEAETTFDLVNEKVSSVFLKMTPCGTTAQNRN
jgi:hypothetical protein